MTLLRYAVFAAFVFAAFVAFGSWAVATRRLHPFSGLARLIHTVSDPVLLPLERWLHRRGGNPQNAPWWLLGLAIAGGIVVITAADWLTGLAAAASRSVQSGPRGVLRLVIGLAVQLVSIALIVRVVGSWFGAGRFNRWMRPAYWLTDWIVEPIRRVLPPLGMIDFSPLVAWLLLQFILIPLLFSVL